MLTGDVPALLKDKTPARMAQAVFVDTGPDSAQDADVVPGSGRGTRTHDLRFWRPPLYQLSYTPSGHRGFASSAAGLQDRV